MFYWRAYLTGKGKKRQDGFQAYIPKIGNSSKPGFAEISN
jgi:hypothetical protein